MTRRDERGVGTLLTAGMCCCLLVVASTASMIVAWLAQVSAVQDAADLASLAAASAHAQGKGGCGAAEAVALRNQSALVDCIIDGEPGAFVVEVRVSQPLQPTLPGMSVDIERRAAAGTLQ